MTDKIIITDEDDNQIGCRTRKDVDKEGLRYRVSSLWITNSKGEFLLAKRALTKKHDPGVWTTAVAGTVEEGESYEQNVVKEAEEELGITKTDFKKEIKLESVGKHKFFVQWFTAQIDKPASEFKIQEDEVAEVKWFTKEEFLQRCRKEPTKFGMNTRKYFELCYASESAELK
ncbi:NUDIX domain-containing protein [Candidatus Woesearchaeota archaeon]|nr:NUDIX domain-containing protein [Candidatus Woesearchaeota archaeon]